MGLFQRAIETYDANSKLVGVYREGHAPLAPIGHILTNANIEITLNGQGQFADARTVGKDEPKILIPITEESGGRTSGAVAHPLCDNLKYIAPNNEEAHGLYLDTLRAWAESEHSHPFLKPILAYVESGTIVGDLTAAGILDKYDEKQMICWRVNGFENEEPACWKNQNLFSAFISYYSSIVAARDINALCMIEGETAPIASQHSKNIIPISANAKLISANDNSGFTYRGRFSQSEQAATVSYTASQKAHNALKWLASEQGVRDFVGNRVFLCWNPKGGAVPKVMRRMETDNAEAARKPSDYRKKLQSTLMSFRADHQLSDTDNVIIASFDAATSGRLAVTYYNEISLGTFLERMRNWDEHCCWYMGKFGIQAPNLIEIVDRAFGTQRDNMLKTDDKIKSQHLQRLLDCKVNGGVLPADIVKILVQRASMPQNYSETNWRAIVRTACAALQKYRYDTKQGGNEMAWDLDKKDRSFQYGRLLAVMERAENDYYYKTQESRQTSAIKFMTEFRQKPFFVSERINRHLHLAYLNRIEPWQATRYEKLVGEIFAILKEFPEDELNKPLDDLYLMGYELQRNAFFTKTETDDNIEEE